MVRCSLDFLANEVIGIIGCGHLGRTLAREIIDHDFPKEKILVSYNGSASTLERIRMSGLLENIRDNAEICRRATIIFIVVRPQAFKELQKLSFPRNALVISCMAGVSSATLKRALDIDIFRIMPSGPDTIKEGKGIVAVYPHSDILIDILSHMGLKVYELPEEEQMHIFTAGVCLPAALLVSAKKGLDTDQAVKTIEKEYPDFVEIYRWARNVLPDVDSDVEREKYVRKMSTKGGITEAIVDSLVSGSTFLTALRSGVARSKEISARKSNL